MNEVILVLLGFLVGIFSGLIGVGGGLLIIPAMLFIYPVLTSTPSLGIKLVTGISAVQGVAGSISSVWIHHGKGNANLRVILLLAVTTMLGSYFGGVTTQWYSQKTLTWVYVIMLSLTLAVSITNHYRGTRKENQNGDGVELNHAEIDHKWLSLFLSLIIGYLSGLLGIGGAILLILLMCNLMKLPIRLAIGSTSGVVFLTSIGTVIGKAQGGLIPLGPALLVALGAVAGGYLGAKLSSRLSENFLFWLLMGIMGLTLVRMIFSL